MKILFICKFNKLRSKLAEGIFNKLNKNPKHKAKSGGLIRGRPVLPITRKVAKRRGIKINKKPKGLTSKMIIWQDLAIIVADDVPKEILKDNKKFGKGLKVWKIKDIEGQSEKEVEKVINQIEKKVKKLLIELK